VFEYTCLAYTIVEEGHVVLMTALPNDQHITYQLQYRKCGKTSCSTCRNAQGHGPYWYAYWREDARLHSGYVGKVNPKGTGDTSLQNEQQAKMTHVVVNERVGETMFV